MDKLEAQRTATKHYRDIAGIRIQFCRDEDRAIVEKALVKLGFKIETTRGASRLIPLKANTIAYGSLVSDKDLRDIAAHSSKRAFPSNGWRPRSNSRTRTSSRSMPRHNPTVNAAC
jgi:hypothetical protein